VADSSIFQAGDYAVFDTPASTLEERQLVQSVPDATHIKVSALKSNHANGSIVRLGTTYNSVYIQPKDGNTGAIFIGNSAAMVKATGAFVIIKLQAVGAGVQPIDTTIQGSGAINSASISELWVDGTTADQYLPSFGVI
jgi:hypothetical protein